MYMIEVLTAWKAVRSEAIVTGDEVLGKAWQKRCAWKALRHRTGFPTVITFIIRESNSIKINKN